MPLVGGSDIVTGPKPKMVRRVEIDVTRALCSVVQRTTVRVESCKRERSTAIEANDVGDSENDGM